MTNNLTHDFTKKESIHKAIQLLNQSLSPEKNYRFMEFCGGHTHVLFRYALLDLLPPNIEMVHGPGCPVCVLPMTRIHGVLNLLKRYPSLYLFTYGDVLRVPGSDGTNLMKAKAQGANIQILYSPTSALRFAQENPEKEVVFLAVGFETTTPPTAQVLCEAAEQGLKNFSVLCYHVQTPPAIESILESIRTDKKAFPLDGILGPGHVSSITGSRIYEPLVAKYQIPLVISGFYPLDLVHSLILLVQQVHSQNPQVQNQYSRTVSVDGNLKAQKKMNEVFILRDSFEWRGLGSIPLSALQIRNTFSEYDAEKRYTVEPDFQAKDHPLCECGAILKGIKSPRDCRIFAKLCTPENPLGACMVSSEGACAAYYIYGKERA